MKLVLAARNAAEGVPYRTPDAQLEPPMTPAKTTSPRTKKSPAKKTSSRGGDDANLELVMRLMAVPGRSGEETAVAAMIQDELRQAGADMSLVRTDDTPERSPLGGQIGNLTFQLPGTVKGPRRLLVAHMDAVPLCVGSKPVRDGKTVRSADKSTGLAADNRAGCATILSAARDILTKRLPHPPLTFLWCVQEEVGLFGARHGDLSLLGKPKLAFNWDGGPAEKLTIGATGAFRMKIAIQGLASHAGGAPEKGISAVTIAALAIADLQQAGWLGLIEKDGIRGTSNVGVVSGGAATNVVTDLVELRAECRAHDAKFRKRILKTFEEAFEKAAASVTNHEGRAGKVKFESRQDYESFLLRNEEPCVVEAERAVRMVGLNPIRAISNGGLDANWLSARGIPTVTLGCGQQNVHTTSERLDIAAFEHACRIALQLAAPDATA
ncbi:MAG: M20/M25/M40 family metallo-hydrolase [Pirellulales bacterium]